MIVRQTKEMFEGEGMAQITRQSKPLKNDPFLVGF